MTSNLQLSGKSASGIIFVAGGDNFDDFYTNLLAIFQGDADLTNATIAEAAKLITPLGVSAPRAQANVPQFQQSAQQQYQQPASDQQALATVQNAFPAATPIESAPSYGQQRQAGGSPPGQQAPLCPNHNQPARWVPPGTAKATGKPFNGFWACAVSQQGDRSCRIAR